MGGKTIQSIDRSATESPQQSLSIHANRSSLLDAAEESILRAPHVAWLLADRTLTIREIFGNTQLIHDKGPWIGERLLDVAPELRGRETDLAALLNGGLERLDIGLVRRPEGHELARGLGSDDGSARP